MSTSPESVPIRTTQVSIVPRARHTWASEPPAPLTPLIGHEAEIAAICRMVRDDGVRLVTITGPGGIGKTRLALGAAAELAASFADAVAWVPLAAIADPGAVVPTVARALSIGETTSVSPLAGLRMALRDARLLLVLDNFEQVLPAAGEVADLLAACPGLVALVTSRSLLRVSGEHIVPVPPLAPPDAVRLFVARARAIAPSFTLDEQSEPQIAEVCQRLDGIPLAIELAASRVNHLSLPALRARLERRLPLLTGGGRDQPARLRTMRDAIAWSYDLLPPSAQAVFRRLALFPAGCRLEAAVAVGGAAPPVPDVLDAIAALVDSSLVREAADPDGEPRYVMLETTREYGLERLGAQGETAATQRGAAGLLLTLAERLELAPFLPDGDRQLALLEAEHANMLDALAWLDVEGDTEGLLRLVGTLAFSWFALGHYRDGQRWLERALARAPERDDAARGKALIGLGFFMAYQNEGDRARALHEAGLALWQRRGVPFWQAMALVGLGALAEHQSDFAQATASLEEALRLSGSVDEPSLAAYVASEAYANLGVAAQGTGDLPRAVSYHEQALALRRSWRYLLGVRRSLGDLGDAARDQGDYARALARYRESLALSSPQPDRRMIADVLAGVAHVAVAWGQPERAVPLLGAAAALREALGTTILLAVDRVASDRATAAARAAMGDAAFSAAWEAGRSWTTEEAIGAVDAISPPASPSPRASRGATRYALTARELDVLLGLTERLTDREIAERLFVSHRTVGWHVTAILAKLGVVSRRAAAAKALQERLLEPGAPSSGGPDR